ncbi:MAG: septal ring lytic transglycosylase RlpA family lipoprotein [Candidatus Rokuibacteriota bacterium]|nr:MAG: septal ring lytic transglycosylase RlpA family lipoprotein [Candidatus Rokubacteria bacterium]
MGRWLLILVLLAGCAVVRPSPPPSASAERTGEASWYGRPFHGRRTASGEVYDMYKLTAAHPTLPFGARVRVTSLRNGRSVEVRINDRGPAVRGRVIDLSYAAARAIDSVGAGVFPVRLRVVALPEP